MRNPLDDDATHGQADRLADLQRLVDQADEAALLLAIDGLSATRDWDLLVALARRCRAAVELGKQLWPVAMHIDYRLALEAPGRYAGGVLAPGAGKFALGPLTEVAASAHDWAALAPFMADPISAAAVAQERVLRGEDLERAHPAPPPEELPLRLLPWEPIYAVPTYRDRSAEFPQPAVATRTLSRPVSLPVGRALVGPDPAAFALRDLVETWVSQSSGRVRTICVEGGAPEAVGALLVQPDGADATAAPAAGLGAISAADALAVMQWAAASGGAYGYRRGGAGGRFAAWWAAAALAGVGWDDDPGFAGELGQALQELKWFRWASTAPDTGWVLRLAVVDPADDLAWAVEAVDQRTDPLEGTGSAA